MSRVRKGNCARCPATEVELADTFRGILLDGACCYVCRIRAFNRKFRGAEDRDGLDDLEGVDTVIASAFSRMAEARSFGSDRALSHAVHAEPGGGYE